jgi:hypothetical protein
MVQASGSLDLQEGAAIRDLAKSFKGSLRALNRSGETIRGYIFAVGLLADFLQDRGLSTAISDIERENVESFIADQLDLWKPKTARIRYMEPPTVLQVVRRP